MTCPIGLFELIAAVVARIPARVVAIAMSKQTGGALLPSELSRRNQQMKSLLRSSGAGQPPLRRSTRMASIPSLVRPAAAFDPDTICRTLCGPRRGLRPAPPVAEASAPSPPMRMPCARWWRVASRHGVKGIGHEKEPCRRRGSISRCKLSTWAETPCPDYGCGQRRLPALLEVSHR